MKPTIIHIRASNFFGGPERQIVSHIKASQRFRHLLVTFLEGDTSNELHEKAVNSGIATQLIRTRFAFDPGAVISMRRIFKEQQPKVICSHGYKPSIIALIAKIGLGIPLIIFSRGHTAENLKVRMYETIEFCAMRWADCVVAVSNGYADHLVKSGIPKSKIQVVQNAIDVNRMVIGGNQRNGKREELGFTDDDFVIATAGRLSPEKAQGNLIQAFGAIQQLHSNAHLLIIGDGMLEDQLKAMAASQTQGNVHFLGFRRDMDEIMSAIDMFVLPSLTEGLPNVVLEAFAAKKPVVATRVGGVPEIVDDGVNGFLCTPGSSDGLSTAIQQALSHKERLVEMGLAGFEKVQKEFSVEPQTQSLERIYGQFINCGEKSETGGKSVKVDHAG